jgi:hypothetical protein
VLIAVLPSFTIVAGAFADHVAARRHHRHLRRERQTSTSTDPITPEEEAADGEAGTHLEAGEQEGLIEREERRLLQSIVDFGDTLVREVMTPRPDIVGARADATRGRVAAGVRRAALLARAGLPRLARPHPRLRLREGPHPPAPGSSSRRARRRAPAPPAHFVPETKRVSGC